MTEARGTSKRHGLAPARRALLEERLRGRKAQADVETPKRVAGTPLPLTPLQAQIWALAQSHPDVPAYNMRRALQFAGDIDVAALRNAIAVVVDRHEALRTVFAVRDRDIVQIVLPQVEIELCIEASDDSSRRAEEEIRKPFDLATGPLIRFLLIKKGPQQHLFVMVVHHIVADEWSLDIVLSEINKAYNGEQIRCRKPYAIRRLCVAKTGGYRTEFGQAY